MTSPFDYRGPEFLAFYLLFGMVALVALYAVRRLGESDDPPPVNFNDPYLIGYLRGGWREPIRIATISLIDRGFLKADGANVTAAPDRPWTALRGVMEPTVARFFSARAAAAGAFQDAGCRGAADTYKSQLTELGLLPDEGARLRQAIWFLIAAGALWGVAGYKLYLAAQRGRHNIQFLVFFAIVFTLIAWFVSRPRVTRRGAALITSLKTLFQPLSDRAGTLLQGANPNEVLLLAAVFGMGALPEGLTPYSKALYPAASSSGCGSSSSCGSSCGGGGCGGGCGGCGS